MKKFSYSLTHFYLKLIRAFGKAGYGRKSGYFGLGQFVVLISLAPFIFDFHLYGAGHLEAVPSIYEYDPYRFEALPAFVEEGKMPKRPRPPRSLSKQIKDTYALCTRVFFLAGNKGCQQVRAAIKNHQRAKARYKKALHVHREKYEVFLASKAKRDNIEKQYEDFKLELDGKPPLPAIDIKEKSAGSLAASLSATMALDSWRITGSILWCIGLLLIFPSVVFSFQRRCWSLLILGLSVPAYNYIVVLISFIPGIEHFKSLMINNTFIAQLAFLWFAIKGHIRCKSYVLFLLVATTSVSVAVSLGDTSHSLFHANLPILVFICASAIARFITVSVRDNFYLFKIKGWIDNGKKGVHAFILWLPLGLSATAVFYFTGTVIPNTTVNHMEAQGTLEYRSDHDLLDNALQSVAVKIDDAVYAWHLTIDSLKLDIYFRSKALQEKDLTAHVQQTFDTVMPSQLDYERWESDAVVGVKQASEIAVAAAQSTTNDAYKRLRANMRSSLTRLTRPNEAAFKEALENNTAKALTMVDDMHQEGLNELLTLSHTSQRSLWWTINTVRALKMLATLLFIFVCIKSFLYVFSRVRFNRESGLFVTLGNIDELPQQHESNIVPTGLQYLIQAEEDTVFYFSRRFQCRGKAPKFAIAQPFGAILARIANKAYTANQITVGKDDDPVRCTATKGIEFFEWNLQAGERVIFDFHHFVGASASVTFSTHLSTRISTLLFGKMLYSVAKGPGKLILMAEGRAEVSEVESPSGSLPPERIIACNIDSRFQIDSEIDLLNIYVSTAYVKPLGVGKVIVDVDSLRGIKTGLGGFIRRFMLPV